MERLTKRYYCEEECEPYVLGGIEFYGDSYGGEVIDKLAEYEDAEEQCIKECGCSLNMVIQKYKEFLEHMHELAEYWKLEEQGLLLRLPCKVGDTVYKLWYANSEPYKVQKLTIRTLANLVAIMEGLEFGKTVFLTKEEAEQKLAEMKGE